MLYSVGIGCRKGVSAADIGGAVVNALALAGIKMEEVAKFATADVKKDEEGLLEFAKSAGKPLLFFSKEELNRVETPNETPRAIKAFGIRSVAEAAALLAGGAGAELILEKQKYTNVTVAVSVINE